MLKLHLALALSALFVLAVPARAADASSKKEKVFALVVKVEGKGVAKLRRTIGTEAVVGSQMEMFPGDRIVTDEDSTVDLVLHDGTLIRVGINADFRLNEAEVKQKFISWLFSLMQGTIRVLAEKAPDPSTVKIRVNTPSGTMGIRGTEVVLGFNPKSGKTVLYTLEGQARFGGLECERGGSCVDISAGSYSEFSSSEPAPVKPKNFQPRELLGLAGDKAAVNRDRLVLFQGPSKASVDVAVAMNEREVVRVVDDARASLQASQDAVLQRTPEIRQAIHSAIQQGTYDQVLEVAQNYQTSRGRGVEAKEFTVINSGPLAAKKFALGLAIIKSPAMKSAGDMGGKEAKDFGDKEPVSNDDFLRADAPPMKRALKWSRVAAEHPAAEVAPEPAGEPKSESAPEATERALRPPTTEERGLFRDPAVQTNYNELINADQAAVVNRNADCGPLCSVARMLTGAGNQPAQAAKPQKKRSRRGGRGGGNSGAAEACENPVMVCTYKSSGKSGSRREKVCNSVCHPGNGSRSAN